ncbi:MULTISPECIES: hypothetical protein [unclassified Bradyrhizobium]|uniref:hypothetical protein n=1 Tax=unclassified Bradyrhizobium TaxID=2631580 RepID=UPI0020A044D6|nr:MULTISPECIES: hypothetical protein [unclassified Bradyrhizobium]
MFEAAELARRLEEKWVVSAATSLAENAPAALGGPASSTEQKTDFVVVLARPTTASLCFPG